MAEIEYLGHIITREELKPAESKFRDISQAPTLKMFLKVFLGLVNYVLAVVSFCQICPQPLHYYTNC